MATIDHGRAQLVAWIITAYLTQKTFVQTTVARQHKRLAHSEENPRLTDS